MRRDDIGGGPFEYFPVSTSFIHDTASDIDGRSSDLDSVRRQVHGEHRLALHAVEGALHDPIRNAPNDIHTRADRIAQATTYAAGCLHLFADLVHQHDETSTSPRSVSLLNRAYSEARLNDFGLEDIDEPDRDHEADRSAGYAALVGPSGTLTIEYQQLQARLDVQAESIAAMLRRGPNLADLRVLWTLGAMPSGADSLWANHRLADVPLLRLPPDLRDGYDDERNLYDLTDDELYELAVGETGTDGFRPAGMLFGQWSEEPEPSDDVPAPWETLDDVAGFIFLDPRACFGDDASIGNCGIEVLGVVPFAKPLKAIKAYRAARRLQRAPEPGPDIPPIHAGRQGKHLPGHSNHKLDGTKSILEADPHELRKFAGTGTPRNNVPRGQPGFKEAIDYGFPIGTFVSRDGQTVVETTRAMIVYAKDGIHLYPIRPQP